MTGFGYDEHDAEWETGDGFRTVSRTDDVEACEVCDKEYDDNDECGCCDGHESTTGTTGTVYCDGTCKTEAVTVSRGRVWTGGTG